MSDEQYAKELIENKFEYGSDYNTAWYVSNCNFTSGAEKRYQFGKKMIEKGLKLYSEGGLFFLTLVGKVTKKLSVLISPKMTELKARSEACR